jgi:hypothetical protein
MLLFSCIFCWFFIFPHSSFALDVVLKWAPNTENDLAGYRVYYWKDTSNIFKLDQVAFTTDVNNETTTTLQGLSPYLPYFIAVTAFNKAGIESSFSEILAVYPDKACAAGDINGDGNIDISDVMLVLRIAVGKANASIEQIACGDVAPVLNGKSSPNGKIDTGDAIVMLSKVVGKVVL